MSEPNNPNDEVTLFGAEPGSTEPQFWVGIGASAGGLEALSAFVRDLPAHLPCTYIVAQHLAPHHRSMLPEIISRQTHLTVEHLEDGTAPKINTVYITPPRYDVIVQGDVLRLVEPQNMFTSPKPSVDRLFSSLASERGVQAVGLVLSGTGTDGAEGIRNILAAGGIAIAQDPATAKYPSMPEAAISTGRAENIASPENIGAQFLTFLSFKARNPLDGSGNAVEPRDPTIELVWLLLRHTQVDFKQYKVSTFQRRVQRRMAAVGLDDIEDYVRLAQSSKKELDELFRDLLISVTSFFRDPSEFESLASALSEALSTKQRETIRVWIAGVATGEEAYSIAMILAEELGGLSAFAQAPVQIFATDIDRTAIEAARQGFYSPDAVENVPPELLDRYFETAPLGYRVLKGLREKILFSVHNVAKDPPFLHLDLICCRNLLIYFQNSLQQQVFDRFHYALRPRGLLFLGKSESIGASEASFVPVKGTKHLFRQRPSERRYALNSLTGAVPREARPKYALSNAEGRELTAANARFESLVLALGDCGLLITPDLQIKKAFGDVTPYLSVNSGPVSPTVSAMLKTDFAQDIRINLPVVINRNQVGVGLTHTLNPDSDVRHRVRIYPVSDGIETDRHGLAVFSSWLEEPDEEDEQPKDAATDRRLSALSDELEIARTNLQQTVEELEISNEELQSLNEELQSSNEELQSTNEELETSNEELQSTNEELSTVNEELQVSGHELNVANQNLQSILENVGIPMLVVDRSSTITHMSAAAEAFFNVKSDEGLPLISRFKVPSGYPNLNIVLLRAMERGETQHIQINTDAHSASLAVVPHYTHTHELIGAIVLISDNTDELISTRAELQLLFDTLPDAIMVQGSDGRIQRANPAACRLFLNVEKLPRDVEVFLAPDNLDQSTIQTLLTDQSRVFRTGEPILGRNYRLVSLSGRVEIHRISIVRSRDQETKEPHTYLISQDVTDTVRAAEALQISEERLQLAISAGGIGLLDWDVLQDHMYWSPRVCEILGLGDQAMNHNFAEFIERIHPEDRERIQDLVEQNLKSPSPIEAEFRLRKEDGTYAQVIARGQVLLSPEGLPNRLIGVIDDVTERYAEMRIMRETKEQLAVAARLGALGYWTFDISSNDVTWSDQLYQIHGLDPKTDQVSLESAISFYHPDDVPLVHATIADLSETGQPTEFEARIIRTDGVERSVQVIGLGNQDKTGKVIGLFGILRDVTDDREREKLLRKTVGELARSNEELNRFSYVCSHDMKEPVRLIESLCGVLQNDVVLDSQDERKEVVGRIIANSVRLRNIIDGLLAYSRIDARVDRGRVDLNSLVKDVLEDLALAIEDKKAEIKVDTIPDAFGARVHFNQLFQNLIGNALKYSDKETPIVEVNASQKEDRLLVRIEDNGPGIPKASREQIFQVFKRLHRQDQIEGSGLGLSICQRIVTQYGGELSCEESKLGGASFVFSLPLYVNENDSKTNS